MQIKQVAGFEDYKISNAGIIFSKNGIKREISPYNDGRYLQIKLYKNGRRYWHKVHRLVLTTFYGPCPKNMETNHKNGIKTDNRIENLEWATKSENVKHAFNLGLTSQVGMKNSNAKLKDGEVWLIKRLIKDGMIPTNIISKMFLLGRGHVWDIKNGKTWKHVQA